MTTTSDILFERRGAAGLVILNRPQALNAVTHTMVRALAERLAAWERDDAVTRVIVSASGERAFSAGGDIRALYEIGRADRQAEALTFFREEYRLNHYIKHYPKPYIALIDGIVMGGGVGISVHGSHRVAGDRYQFAMPEVGIGFFPDVGATFALPRLKGLSGTYLALTGERMRADDGVALGAATHRVRSGRFAELQAALCGADPVDATLAAFAEQGQAGPLTARLAAIDRLFAADTVPGILAALGEAGADAADADWAKATAAAIRSKSPLSLCIAREQMLRGSSANFAASMQIEFRIVSRIVYDHDFYEGVRAVIVDKDNAPRWRPASLEEVDSAMVARHFAALEGEELTLP